jgi:hypothetical protein
MLKQINFSRLFVLTAIVFNLVSLVLMFAYDYMISLQMMLFGLCVLVYALCYWAYSHPHNKTMLISGASGKLLVLAGLFLSACSMMGWFKIDYTFPFIMAGMTINVVLAILFQIWTTDYRYPKNIPPYIPIIFSVTWMSLGIVLSILLLRGHISPSIVSIIKWSILALGFISVGFVGYFSFKKYRLEKS